MADRRLELLLAGDIIASNKVPDNDQPVPQGLGNAGTDEVNRLREGIERFTITDVNNPAATAQAQSQMEIMWDIVSAEVDAFNHVPGGANVLHLDGHVKFIRYPSPDWPVSVLMANLSAGIIRGAAAVVGDPDE